jgi:4-carboxymuconolactone decarboxylase
VRVNAAPNVGLSPAEVVLAIVHGVPFVGFPRALKALAVAKRGFEERGVDIVPRSAPKAAA